MKSSNFNSLEKNQTTNQEIISMINQSTSQEILNYNQINSSISSSNKIQDKNRIEIGQKNIQMLIIQRSLYIMKQRFAQNRQETLLVYEKYKNPQYKSLECISTQNLFECLKEVFNTNQINLYPYDNFNDLSTADLVSGTNEDKYNKIINELVAFIQKNVVKYNEKFYENKMKKKKLKEEEEQKRLNELEKNDISDQIKIVHKNKRGDIISDFQKITEKNKKVVINELIYKVTEEDMTILTSNKLLYHGVIPLIIADFIQENMEKNIKIGIIITNRNFFHEKEDLQLEKDIKILFDREIMKLYNNLNRLDPDEEKNEDLKKLLFECNSIDNKIKLFNELILENTKRGEDFSYLIEMIKKLKEQKILYQKKISEINNNKISINYSLNTLNSQSQNYSKTINTNTKTSNSNTSFQNKNIKSTKKTMNIDKNKLSKINNKSISSSKNNSKIHMKLKKKLTKEELRNKALKEIFQFYCKQHSFLGYSPTFGDLLTKEELMNLSDFIKFCIDFKILVKKDRITKIYKQDLKDASKMTYEEFLQCIKKMAKLMHDEKVGYKRDKINMYLLQKNELIEKENNNNNNINKDIIMNDNNNVNKDIIMNDKNNNDNNEEEKNIEQIIEKVSTQENDIKTINENQNNSENNNEKNNNQEKKIEKERIVVKNIENKEEEKKSLNGEGTNEEKKDNNIQKTKLKNPKKLIKKTNQTKEPQKIIQITKEDLEEKISKLENELQILEQKTPEQITEDFYMYLELDDPSKYQKRMVGYTRPFLVREDDTRNPEKNVKNPIKFNKQLIMKKYEYLLQRKDNIKKQKELENKKEKHIEYEERKKSFNKHLKKLEKDYDSRIKRDNYIQIKKDEEDYLKGKNNKLTWKYIQKNDYQAFLLNDEKNMNNNSMPSQLNDIFNKNDFMNDFGDDDSFINKIYSNNKRPQNRKNFYESRRSKEENSRYDAGESFSKFSNLSID